MADRRDMPRTDVSFDLGDPVAMRDLFNEAASLNLSCPLRRGAVVELPEEGRAVLTGDLHDARGHLGKLLKLSRISYSENYHLVLQETIHGEDLVNGLDLSYRCLAEIAEQKVLRPDQVHHVQSNHELAQMNGEGIVKGSVSVVDAFNDGLESVFGGDAGRVGDAIGRYIGTLPLAVRCANGVMCAHSLPNGSQLRTFDAGVMDRRLTADDMSAPSGAAYVMTWGRSYTDRTAEELAERWGVELFVLGHQHVEMGWDVLGSRVLILNTDHEYAHALPVDLSRRYTLNELMDEVVALRDVE